MSNDMMMLIGGGVLVVGVAMLAMLHFYFTSGVHGTLATARPGEVYNFDYEQPLHGEHKRVLAKVVEPVYRLSDSSIKHLNRTSRYRKNDPVFKRTQHIVVCEMPNGDVRQFYAERAKNVRRSVFGNQLFKVAALL